MKNFQPLLALLVMIAVGLVHSAARAQSPPIGWNQGTQGTLFNAAAWFGAGQNSVAIYQVPANTYVVVTEVCTGPDNSGDFGDFNGSRFFISNGPNFGGQPMGLVPAYSGEGDFGPLDYCRVFKQGLTFTPGSTIWAFTPRTGGALPGASVTIMGLKVP